MTAETILIADDDPFLRERLAQALHRRGFETYEATGIAAALQIAQEQSIDRAIIDLRMEDGSGLELLAPLTTRFPDIRIVMLTGFGSITNAVEAIKAGAHDYVTKPADVEQILLAFADKSQDQTTVRQTPATLAEQEWEHIQRVLHECGGNLTRAARMLDIPRRSLQRKLKKLAPQASDPE